jgi:hypothetical protein
MITVSKREDTYHKDEPTIRHSAWKRECVLSNGLVIRHAVVENTYEFPEEEAAPLLDDWEAESLAKLNGESA